MPADFMPVTVDQPSESVTPVRLKMTPESRSLRDVGAIKKTKCAQIPAAHRWSGDKSYFGSVSVSTAPIACANRFKCAVSRCRATRNQASSGDFSIVSGGKVDL